MERSTGKLAPFPPFHFFLLHFSYTHFFFYLSFHFLSFLSHFLRVIFTFTLVLFPSGDTLLFVGHFFLLFYAIVFARDYFLRYLYSRLSFFNMQIQTSFLSWNFYFHSHWIDWDIFLHRFFLWRKSYFHSRLSYALFSFPSTWWFFADEFYFPSLDI